MATAYVLINVEIGSEEEVLRSLDPISEVKKIRMLNLPRDVEERIFWKNIAEILDIVEEVA